MVTNIIVILLLTLVAIVTFIYFFIIFIRRNPESYSKPRKTFISLTTIPDRLSSPHFVDHMKYLTSLLDDEQMILNIPKISKSGKHYIIPKELYFLRNFNINIVDIDEGPITKLLPSLRNNKIDDNDIIIIIDDDKVYKPKSFYILKKLSSEYPNSIISFCNKRIQGYAGFSFIKKTLKGLIKRKIPSECFKIDDYVIGQFVKYKNIPIRVAYYTLSEEYKIKDRIINSHMHCSHNLIKSDRLIFSYKAPQLIHTTNKIKQSKQCKKVLEF